jgi:hypothetical protein
MDQSIAAAALTGLLRGKKEREEKNALLEEKKQMMTLQKEQRKLQLEGLKAAQAQAAQKQAFITRLFPQSQSGLGELPSGPPTAAGASPKYVDLYGGGAAPQGQPMAGPVDTGVIDMLLGMDPMQQEMVKELTGINVPGVAESVRKREQDAIQNQFNALNAQMRAMAERRQQDEYSRGFSEGSWQQQENPDGSKSWVKLPKFGAGPSGTQSAPSKLDLPMSLNEIESLRNPENSSRPEIGTTLRQAGEKGFIPSSTGQETQRVAIAGTMALLDTMEGLADKVFKANSSIGRLGEVPRAMIAKKLQNDPTVALYESLKEGSLAKFIKGLGDVGAMTESDLERARNLVPSFYPIPDTRDVAMGKLKQLKQLFSDIEKRSYSGGAGAAAGAGPAPKRLKFNPATGMLE